MKREDNGGYTVRDPFFPESRSQWIIFDTGLEKMDKIEFFERIGELIDVLNIYFSSFIQKFNSFFYLNFSTAPLKIPELVATYTYVNHITLI